LVVLFTLKFEPTSLLLSTTTSDPRALSTREAGQARAQRAETSKAQAPFVARGCRSHLGCSVELETFRLSSSLVYDRPWPLETIITVLTDFLLSTIRLLRSYEVGIKWRVM
jgi:hypothetical protein